MDRCANMRGTYFVEYLNGTRGAGATNVQVASLATRTKVLGTVACSKSAAKSKITTEREEHELWGSAGESIVHHSVEFDTLENANVNEY